LSQQIEFTEVTTFVEKAGYAFAIDTIGPFPESGDGKKYVLVVIDLFTRWTELLTLETLTADEAATV
ncbi:hypothetical protein ADUPG1_003327, partial [Aduncisulcus paluster]